MGSSPLSRGILRLRDRKVVTVGIIPALAGNTVANHDYGGHVWDHPRSRGEYATMYGFSIRTAGSSPLSRGIQGREDAGRGAGGIIPALAGNTCCRSRSVVGNRDHPRSRGEYTVIYPINYGRRGSSPLSRGILYRRITPSGR